MPSRVFAGSLVLGCASLIACGGGSDSGSARSDAGPGGDEGSAPSKTAGGSSGSGSGGGSTSGVPAASSGGSLDAGGDGLDGVPPALGVDGAPASGCARPMVVTNDAVGGRLEVDSDVLSLEFGYTASAATNHNQSGGNLYRYIDKRFSTTQNVISVWDGGSAETEAYASGVGGIGNTELYAVATQADIPSGSYSDAIADNTPQGVLTSGPTWSTSADGSVVIVFDVSVKNPTTSVTWYEVKKTWTVACGGRISLELDWTILQSGWFSEPATRLQIATVWSTISRWGHPWSEPPSGPPGTDSRANSANRWWDWTPDPNSTEECNFTVGGQDEDALHVDYSRYHGGPIYDFWFWPDNGGKGYEAAGFYGLGYKAFGGSANASNNEICHENRTSVGDGADAYNEMPAAWWGGDGAGTGRYKPLSSGVHWTDTYGYEVLPTGTALPQ